MTKLYQVEFEYSGYSFEEQTEADPLNDAVGRVAMNFGDLEDVLSSCITYLIGAESEKGLTVTSEMPFKAKLHVLVSLIRKEYETRELAISASDFADLITMCTKSEEFRNTILHSSWIYDHSGPKTTVLRRKRSAKLRRGYQEHEEPLTPGQVLDIADYIVTASWNLDEYFISCFEDYRRLLEHVRYA